MAGRMQRLHRLCHAIFAVCFWHKSFVNSTTEICDGGEAVPLSDWLIGLNLPPEILTHFVSSRGDLRKRCREDPMCPFKKDLNSGECIGYERGCDFKRSFSYKNTIECWALSRWPNARTNLDQKQMFWTQTDMGLLQMRLDSMVDICISSYNEPDASSLTCSDNLRHCRAKNIFFDFKSFSRQGSSRYREDVIHKGEVGGRCSLELRNEIIQERSDHKSYLQSWAHELGYFQSYKDFKVDREHCDVIFERPTIIIKLDAAVSMYHHFCDFVNLYASQHINGSFDDDVDILWWDTHPAGFRDTMFGATWRAFSRHKPVELIALEGKRVCFKDALMPLLARQRLGLYFNLPVIDNCRGSALFRWFSKHVLHRLNVTQTGPHPTKIRVALLSRVTEYRRILNEDKIVEALRAVPEFDFKVIFYKPGSPTFLEQLQITHNFDIFMSMHGAGLTHALFLPDWAGVFEIFNCDDAGCYYDLVRLRGLNYRTWEKPNKMTQHGPGVHPHNGGPHKKFTNYSFDVDEFMRIVLEIADYVRNHSEFVAARARRKNMASCQPATDKDEL